MARTTCRFVPALLPPTIVPRGTRNGRCPEMIGRSERDDVRLDEPAVQV